MPADRLPPWRRVLVVVAHPDDESFGLGGIIGAFTRAGAEVSVLCFTHGEASTLGTGDLREVRRRELTDAARVLGVGDVHLHDFEDGSLSAVVPELTDVVTRAIGAFWPDGLLTFHVDGVTGHPDHSAATTAAINAAASTVLPLAQWTLPRDVARTMSEETGGEFSGYPDTEIDLRIKVSRELHHRAIAAHPSQAVPGSPLWRRLELLGEYEHLILA